MESNYFGTLRMCRGFAPVLAADGGGAIVTMLSLPASTPNRSTPPTRLESGRLEFWDAIVRGES
jgi:NAD(P)-dependent dehydrogenase (short-subunit alcohol dehydrogenase family)